MKSFQKEIKLKFVFVVFALIIALPSAKSQSATTNTDNTQISSFFSELIKGARLKFCLPAGYAFMHKDELNVNWDCSRDPDQYSLDFHQMLNNSDSTILIAITIFANFPNAKGSPGRTKTNWKNNAKIRDKRQLGKGNHGEKIDPDLLGKVWNTDYGVVYSRPCTLLYKARYASHKVISVAHDDWEMEVVYFYNKPDIIKFVDLTSSFLRSN